MNSSPILDIKASWVALGQSRLSAQLTSPGWAERRGEKQVEEGGIFAP